MKGFTRASLAAVVAAAAALALAACGTTGGTTSTGKDLSTTTVKLAYQGPLTGDNAAYGSYAKAGIEVALADYEKAYPKGPKVEIVYSDTQGDPAQAPAVGTDLINDAKVIGVVGPAFSGETKATEPAYAEAGLTTISMSATNPTLSTNGWKTFHRVVAPDSAQGPAAAKLMVNTLKYTKVFVVDDSSDYGVGLGDEVRKTLGSVLIGSDKVQVKDTDFSATVTKVKASGADAIYYAGYAPEAALLLKQLKDAGFTGTFLSGDGTVDAAFLTAGSYTDGAILTFPGILDAGDSFTAKWKALKVSDKGTIGAYTLESYDAASVFLNGIGDGKITRAALLKYVDAYDKKGLTKTIQFDSTGEIKGASGVFYYLVKGGKTIYKGPAE